jgi:hypothetical protein
MAALIKSDLVKLVRSHRLERGIPIGDPAMDIETWICKQLPAGLCVEEITGSAPVTHNKGLGMQDVLSFLNSVAHIFKNGGLVDQPTAEARANICLSCPRNTPTPGCRPCSGIASFVYKLLGSKILPQQQTGKLTDCGVCGCPLAAKCWVPTSFLEEQQQIKNHRHEYPAHCWMNK